MSIVCMPRRVPCPPVPPEGNPKAEPGSVSERTLAVLALLMRVHEARYVAIRRVIGHRIAVSDATRYLTYQIVWAWHAGRPLSLAEAQRAVADIASKTTVRKDIDYLEGFGLIARERHGVRGRSRTTCLFPTPKLVAWFNEEATRYAGWIAETAERWQALTNGEDK